jgi:large subunit ribosomal protein L29
MDISELKKIELRAKTTDELVEILEEAQKEYAEMKFLAATNQIENTSKITHMRRGIARLKTLLTERQTTEAEG